MLHTSIIFNSKKMLPLTFSFVHQHFLNYNNVWSHSYYKLAEGYIKIWWNDGRKDGWNGQESVFNIKLSISSLWKPDVLIMVYWKDVNTLFRMIDVRNIQNENPAFFYLKHIHFLQIAVFSLVVFLFVFVPWSLPSTDWMNASDWVREVKWPSTSISANTILCISFLPSFLPFQNFTSKSSVKRWYTREYYQTTNMLINGIALYILKFVQICMPTITRIKVSHFENCDWNVSPKTRNVSFELVLLQTYLLLLWKL